VCWNSRRVLNCNQQLCTELWSVINFHREIEPANLLQYYGDKISEDKMGRAFNTRVGNRFTRL
jgi:hypothetical protein